MAKNMRNSRGFTLAEVMIVLTVIGVLTAILLPVARQSMPDENLMKFKKAHNTLGTVIRELVTSDKYYRDGDLGVTANGENLADTDETRSFFCKTIADLVNAKSSDCNIEKTSFSSAVFLNGNTAFSTAYVASPVTDETIAAAKERADNTCGWVQSVAKKEIVLNDGTIFYSTNSTGFASSSVIDENGDTVSYKRYFSPPNQFPANFADDKGFDVAYKIFCIDIDGFSKGEDPFGYGIRADGKILTGKRAQEWLERDVNEE